MVSLIGKVKNPACCRVNLLMRIFHYGLHEIAGKSIKHRTNKHDSVVQVKAKRKLQ